MDWLTWLRIIVVSGGVSAAATFVVFRLFGDYWLKETLAKLKVESAKEIEKLKAELTKEAEQYRARLKLSHTAIKEVSKCLFEVNIAFSKLHPIVAGQDLGGEEVKSAGKGWILCRKLRTCSKQSYRNGPYSWSLYCTML